MGNWHDEIFAYFDHPITNAYTESLNSLIRVMNRLGRGYSFDALRARILFTEGWQKTKKPKYKKQRNMVAEPTYRYSGNDSALLTSYGTQISTLIKQIEAGQI